MTESTTINLKENLFITIGNNLPAGASKMISGSLSYISENEAKWYVQQIQDRFKDYVNGANQLKASAKESLRTAIQKLAGKNVDSNNIKFKIFSTK